MHQELNQIDKKRGITFPDRNEQLAEFFGVLTGDGFMNEYKTRQAYLVEISGNKLKDWDYLRNFVTKLSQTLFNLTPKFIIRKNVNTILIAIRSKGIYYFLRDCGFPSGEKGEIIAPNWIKENPILYRSFIRGLFDTDGCLCLKNKEGKKYPVIGIASKSKSLLVPTQEFLRNLGISSYLDNNRLTNVYKLQISGKRNINLFFDIIGSNNMRNQLKYREMGRVGIEPTAARGLLI